MADDLHDLQGIAPSNIEKLGANQFGYIDRYLQTRNEPAFQAKMFPFSYVYFGAAIGIPGLVEQEIEVIKEAASALAEACPTWKLVVRPYPVLREWERYEALKQIDNIVLDDAFRQADRSVSDDMIMQKFRAIEQAEVFLHMGTTLGVEAAYTATPSVIVDYDRFVADKKKKGLALYHFVHQYQNEKYLIAPLGSLRVVSPDDFKRLFAQVRLQGKAAMVAPNLKLRVSFPVAGFGEIAERLSTLVETI